MTLELTDHWPDVLKPKHEFPNLITRGVIMRERGQGFLDPSQYLIKALFVNKVVTQQLIVLGVSGQTAGCCSVVELVLELLAEMME